MGSFKRVPRFCVFKSYFTPPFGAVAIYAGGFRIIFFIKGGLMDIFMAIDTLFAYVSETPFFTFFMTFKTGGCQVCTRQLKGTLIVHFQGITGLIEAQGGMACGTVR